MIWYLHRNHRQCVFLKAADLESPVEHGENPSSLEQDRKPTTGGSQYSGTLHLRGGTVHPLEIPADAACLGSLRGLLSGGLDARKGKLFQVPLQQGRSVLTFSGADVLFISLSSAASANPHHPLTQIDEGHLGGYLRSQHPRAAEFGTQHGDPATYTPELWQWVIDTLGVVSMLDVGCGEGHAAAFFRDRGCTVLGVDGSAQAECDSVIAGLHHRHDYSLGPFVPPGSWDLVWSCEFVEHVEERYAENFLASFACARKYLMLTFAPPGQPGWHHVNCQPGDYWVQKMNHLGFRLDDQLTDQARAVARAGHFKHRGLVFVRAEPPQLAHS
jgi:SAM-dependent methyltransferase